MLTREDIKDFERTLSKNKYNSSEIKFTLIFIILIILFFYISFLR